MRSGHRHEFRAAGGGGLLDEIDDGLLGRALVPRGQGIAPYRHDPREHHDGTAGHKPAVLQVAECHWTLPS